MKIIPVLRMVRQEPGRLSVTQSISGTAGSVTGQ